MSATRLLGWLNGAHNRGGSIAASASASTHPASNLRSPRIARPWRSDNATGAKAIVIDMGPGGHPVKAITLHGTNLRDSATVTAALHTADSWGTPDHPAEAVAMEGGEGRLLLDVHEQYRYARISMTDAAHPDVYLEVGAIGLWHCEEIADCITSAGLQVSFTDASTAVATAHGAETSRTLTPSSDLAVSFVNLARHQAQRLREIFREVGGGAPVWLCTDTAQLFGRTQCYGTIGQLPSENLADNPTGLWADMSGLSIVADRRAA